MTLVAAQLSVSLDGCYAGPRDEDGGEVPWGADPPFRAPVFVVTSRPRETLQREGGTSFSYVTDGLASAVEQARAAAGDRNVAIAGGGSVVRQALAAGLVDELELHVSPVVLVDGLRVLDAGLGLSGLAGIELTPLRVVSTPQVTHLRYRVEGRAPLVLDDRGSSGRPRCRTPLPGSRPAAGLPAAPCPPGRSFCD